MERAIAETPAERSSAAGLDNDGLIIRLLYTVNHLSRWLSPIHDETRLQRSPVRNERSPKEIVVAFRDEELSVFPKVHAIAVQNRPNLDRLPLPARSEEDRAWDRQAATFEVMAEFRRLRQSTCSLLRSLPDDAWQRDGISRQQHDWTIRTLAEHLATSDVRLLGELDLALERSGARGDIAGVSRKRLPELLRLAR